jgi:hypothetical protein
MILAIDLPMEVGMTNGMKTAVVAGFVAAYGLGVWTAPQVRDIATNVPADAVVVDVESPRVSAPVERRNARTIRTEEPASASALVATSAPVQKHVKPLLTWGSDPEKAAEGFANAEQFVTVAHAAKNTAVPFMLLKHRVLNEGQTLEAAIRASKPELDASLEADRARLDARAELSRIGD